MRKMILWGSACVLALGLALARPACGQEIVLLTSGEWPPYYSACLPHGGMGTHVVQQAFAAAGVKTIFSYFPWKRGYELARSAGYDGGIGWNKRPDRESLFWFSEPYLSDDQVLFHRSDTPFDWDVLEDIGDYVIGGTLSYAHVSMMRKAVRGRKGRLELVASDLLNLRKLVEGRIEVFPCSKGVGEYLLATEFSQQAVAGITYHPKPLYRSELHVIIRKTRKGGRELVERFNQGLRQLKASGRYAQILHDDRLKILNSMPKTGQ